MQQRATTIGILMLGILSTAAQASQFGSAAADLGATFNGGLIPIGIPAVTVTASQSGVWATGDNFNPNIYNPYNQPSTLFGVSPDAGKYPDFNWIADGYAPAGSLNTVWNFATYSNEAYLYPSIDHTPLPYEALEVTLWGSSDGGATWIPGLVVEVYENGWSYAGICDDGATRWQFTTPVNMITAVPELNQGAYHSNAGGDYEIDAVMQTPAPGGVALLSLGAMFTPRRRR